MIPTKSSLEKQKQENQGMYFLTQRGPIQATHQQPVYLSLNYASGHCLLK